MKKIIFGALFLIGLIYILYPGPATINDFPQLPDSKKSDEVGDTVQTPNIAAYFSFLRREDVTKYYKTRYEKLSFIPFSLPSLTLNHPPEYAYTSVRDQLKVTFLEEYIYPLRDSIFVAGLDKRIYNDLQHISHDFNSDTIFINGVYYNSKITLRYYPSSDWARVLIYMGIWIFAAALLKLFVRSLKEY